ncbi:MAG: GTPase HflX, partial [bacterium]|nr:GTPase HflX [bacterium]
MNQSPTERAILVGVALSKRKSLALAAAESSAGESLDELASLAHSAGAEIVDQMIQVRTALDPATLIGSGKVEELSAAASAMDADVVLFDQDLTPTQLRNLERAL